MRITARANDWMNIEKRISRKRKGNIISSRVIPAYMNTLDTMARTEKQTGEGPGLQQQKPGKNNRGS